jgi:hypothetical protein
MGPLIFDYHQDRSPTYGHEATREAAMAAFAKSWRARLTAPGGVPRGAQRGNSSRCFFSRRTRRLAMGLCGA